MACNSIAPLPGSGKGARRRAAQQANLGAINAAWENTPRRKTARREPKSWSGRRLKKGTKGTTENG